LSVSNAPELLRSLFKHVPNLSEATQKFASSFGEKLGNIKGELTRGENNKPAATRQQAKKLKKCASKVLVWLRKQLHDDGTVKDTEYNSAVPIRKSCDEETELLEEPTTPRGGADLKRQKQVCPAASSQDVMPAISVQTDEVEPIKVRHASIASWSAGVAKPMTMSVAVASLTGHLGDYIVLAKPKMDDAGRVYYSSRSTVTFQMPDGWRTMGHLHFPFTVEPYNSETGRGEINSGRGASAKSIDGWSADDAAKISRHVLDPTRERGGSTPVPAFVHQGGASQRYDCGNYCQTISCWLTAKFDKVDANWETAVAITGDQKNEEEEYVFKNTPDDIVDFLADMIKGGGGQTGPGSANGCAAGDTLGGSGQHHREYGVTQSLRGLWSSAEELQDRWCKTKPSADQEKWAHDIR
jgi:hypothetical protein